MSNKHYIGLDLTGFEDKGEARPVSRVTLYVDDENVVTAGDDTGLELTGDCPNATQAMVDAILARVKGYKYKMYSATSANLDPAAELGDGVTAGGIYSVISKISDGGDGYPDLDAPGEAEPEDEFPTEGPVTKAFNKKISDTRATITKTAEEINLSVSKKVGYDEIISSINQTAEQITIDASKISLEGLVTVNKTFQIDEQGYLTCTGGKIGGFTITGSSLYNGLSSFAGTANGVYIGTDGISLGGGKFKVDKNGNLTASSGTFTGKVRANQIQVGGDAGYITGAQIGNSTVTGGNVAEGTITGGNIGYQTVGVGNMGTNSIENRCIQSGSIINSTISGSAGITSGKFSQDVQNLLADIMTANQIFAGTASANNINSINSTFSASNITTAYIGTLYIGNSKFVPTTLNYKTSSNTNGSVLVLARQS